MEDKSDIKNYYKNLCDDPEKNDENAVAVNSCTRKAACLPPHVKQALGMVHDDVIKRSYGCSTAYPEALKGAAILDLGCGSGRDCFVLGSLVGQEGSVMGMDMLEEALTFAKSHVQYHQEKYGYSTPNISFVKGYMENMGDAGMKDDTFDVIISNCVISLCKDKKAVLKEAARVLKPYGEMYFSDMYRQGDPPPHVMSDNKLWCEGLTGSMTYQQLHAIAEELGFATPRLVKASEIPVVDTEIREKLGNVKYAAVTYRLFKKSPAPPTPTSNFVYKGGIQGFDESFQFDHNLRFERDCEVTLDQETAAIFTHARYSPFFERRGTKVEDKAFQVVDPFTLL